ncbi:hypothetical protein [Pseudogemmobacter faecipullorum]|uniref:Uncharacterized protein n=1 Tax=Pseudogemmobacter faecipullorum TaxID=2755041 RepID=A0ABS8CKA7_9RHOB|nr:hypothetical protein [Pseudogemmobacter faecipullorum]MCB5409810.1 hypothetical protein [Pseudogemmobacter faecipullorum]
MKTLITLAAATAVLASGSFATIASPLRDAPVPAAYGEKIEVSAGTVLSAKELHQRNLTAADILTVTKAPNGPVDTSSGR